MRARLRALLRLGRGSGMWSSGLRSRLRVRSLPRVLEPRVHVLRAARGRHADAASGTEHRHRARARARRAHRPAGGFRLRHGRLSEDHVLGRDGVGSSLRRLTRRDEGAPRARRPRARDGLHCRRGRRTLERGTRLRPAKDHSPGRPARAADRHALAVPRGPLRHRDRADGRDVSRGPAAPRRDPPRPHRRGGAVRRDARARDEALRRSRPPRTRSAATTPSRSRRPTASRWS